MSYLTNFWLANPTLKLKISVAVLQVHSLKLEYAVLNARPSAQGLIETSSARITLPQQSTMLRVWPQGIDALALN